MEVGSARPRTQTRVCVNTGGTGGCTKSERRARATARVAQARPTRRIELGHKGVVVTNHSAQPIGMFYPQTCVAKCAYVCRAHARI